MTKLTKYTRECIACNATAFAFDGKQKDQAGAEDALAREVHAAIFTADELKAVAKVPSNWVRFDRCLRFNCAGVNAILCTADEGLPVPYRIGDYAGYGYHRLGTIEAGDLADRILAHMQLTEKTKSDRAVAYRQTLKMLEGVSTIKKLSEVWPQGEQFYAKYAAAPAVQLPAVRIDEVNAMLGLAA